MFLNRLETNVDQIMLCNGGTDRWRDRQSDLQLQSRGDATKNSNLGFYLIKTFFNMKGVKAKKKTLSLFHIQIAKKIHINSNLTLVRLCVFYKSCPHLLYSHFIIKIPLGKFASSEKCRFSEGWTEQQGNLLTRVEFRCQKFGGPSKLRLCPPHIQ